MAQLNWTISITFLLFNIVCSQTMDGYYTYSEFMDKVENYDYSYLGEKSHQGRDIPYIKLSNEDGFSTRKSILLVGGLNSSPIGLSQIFWNIDRLIEKNEEGIREIDALLKTNHIYLVPMLNIDGYAYISENWEAIKNTNSTETTRRKNMNTEGCPDGKYGVDLSRNFEYQWGYDDLGSSSDPCHSNYRGSHEFSEPEMRALRDLANTLDLVLYMSYGTGESRYVMPYSWDETSTHNWPYGTSRAWFYYNTTQTIHEGYDMGTTFELTGLVENGVDIDYFENEGSAALQVQLNEVNLIAEDLEYGSPKTLVENYSTFEKIVLRTSNTFDTSSVDRVETCLTNCTQNSVGIMTFHVNLNYEDLVDSEPIYLKFYIENPEKDYLLHYRGLTTTKYTHELYQHHTPTNHNVTVDNTNIVFELDLGSIEAETSLDIEIQIEYSKEKSKPGARLVDYEYYVGFAEDKLNDQLIDTIYKRYDRVILNHSISDLDSDDKDDSDGHSDGLSKNEEIAVGVCVTLFVLAVIGLVVWWICRKNQRTPQQGSFGNQFGENPGFEPALAVPQIPSLKASDDATNRGYTDPNAIEVKDKYEI